MSKSSPIRSGRRTRPILLAAAAAAAMEPSFASRPASAAPTYEIVPLGTLGGSFSRANSVKMSDGIFGYATTAQSVKRPVVWREGGILDLGAPPGFVIGEAVAGNAAGQIAVLAENTSVQSYTTFLWEDDVWTDIGLLPGYAEAIPEDMDSAGRIVGRAFTLGPGGGSAAFLWDDGVMTDLGTLGGSGARAYDVNEAGQVVGWSRQPEVGGVSLNRAFLWESGTMTSREPLPTYEHSQAFGVNETGDVVGSSWVVTSPQFFSADRATLWRGTGEIVDLGRTPGPEACVSGLFAYTDNIARAVNAHGQVVGHAQCVASGGALAAFLWEHGVMHNLNDLVPAGSGWDLVQALDINDDGDIVGWGIRPDTGTLQAFLLVPEVPVDAPVPAAASLVRLSASPSPVRASVNVSFTLPRTGAVDLAIYDVAGRRVATLADGSAREGRHSLTWDGTRDLAPGVYFLRLEAAGESVTRKLVRVR